MELSYKQYAELMDELVAEGYDVFEASEMIFDGQLNEMGSATSNRPGQQSTARGAVTMYAQPRPNTRQPYVSRFQGSANAMRSWQQLKTKRGDAPMVPNLGSNYRGQELQAGARASASQVGTSRQGSAGTGAAPSAASPKPTPRVVQTSRPVGPAATQPRQPGREAMIASNIARSQSASAKAAPTSSSTASTPMQQWAAANPKLAAASAERERTRGTSATTNPLMKDFKSRLPAPQTPSPTTSSTAFSKTTPSLGASTPAMQSAGSAAAAKPAPTSAAATGFKLAAQGTDLSQTKKNQQKINAGMEIRGDKLQEDLRVSEYGKNARPDSLLEAYQAIYNS